MSSRRTLVLALASLVIGGCAVPQRSVIPTAWLPCLANEGAAVAGCPSPSAMADWIGGPIDGTRTVELETTHQTYYVPARHRFERLGEVQYRFEDEQGETRVVRVDEIVQAVMVRAHTSGVERAGAVTVVALYVAAVVLVSVATVALLASLSSSDRDGW